jgi:hypothetical protein
MKKFIATTIKEFLNEEQTINEELIVYHRSQKKFDKFDISKINSGSKRQINGWGLYFTDSINISREYGDFLYQVTLFKGKKLGDYILIDFSKPVEKGIVSKIVEAVYKKYNKDFNINKFNLYYDYIKDKSLPKVDFNDYELVQFDYSGFLFYRTLSRVLGGDKYASLFLLNNGIDGLKIRDSKNSNDYIIFDANSIEIEKITYEENSNYY